MSRTMKAIRKPRAELGLVVEDVPIPEPGPHDVLVRVEAASICGTDLHIYNWDDWSRNRIVPPSPWGTSLPAPSLKLENWWSKCTWGTTFQQKVMSRVGTASSAGRARPTCARKHRS